MSGTSGMSGRHMSGRHMSRHTYTVISDALATGIIKSATLPHSQAHALKSNKSLNHHCHLQSAWPSPSSCAGCLPQRSHTALAPPLYGHSEQQVELQSSHPKGEDTKLTVTNVVRIKGKVPNISQ